MSNTCISKVLRTLFLCERNELLALRLSEAHKSDLSKVYYSSSIAFSPSVFQNDLMMEKYIYACKQKLFQILFLQIHLKLRDRESNEHRSLNGNFLSIYRMKNVRHYPLCSLLLLRK